ncbi:hypothetical protein J3L11_05960 [Shewanella sp. 4t3-1-2LB]|uniref:major capsid protein n=1 Tax=Shewanella sp. 4t3-1-2LB TaxID=2817682 RepID=UPI001A98A875|nr:major capsid protein [Shewanella sp. 4t3-1-2LB]MBO1271194.1 hypothetical protein [Shewanella sp. 4t3-1-2LB]
MNKSRAIALVAALGATVVTTASQAAIDVTGATDAITTDGTAAVSAIGLAMLGLAAVAVVYKWAKASIFG